MTKKSKRMRILFAGIVTCAVAATALISVWAGSNTAKDPNQTAQQAAQPPEKQPIIIWHYSGFRDSPQSVKLALSSGLITHVSIGAPLHRKDRYHKKDAEVLQAVRIAKSYGAKVIWIRWLWPGYAVEQSHVEDLFDPNYYIQEITALRAEAAKVGADFVGFDTEPYGKTPMSAYSRGEIRLNSNDLRCLKSVIKQVIETAGKVDFILPSGWRGNRMPHDILAMLGVNRISETTYYSNYKRIKNIKTSYEIFGAYVSTTRENKEHPNLPYFTISEIFDNSYLWSDKKGLWLYHFHKQSKSESLARDLVAYAESLPDINSIEEQKPNTRP